MVYEYFPKSGIHGPTLSSRRSSILNDPPMRERSSLDQALIIKGQSGQSTRVERTERLKVDGLWIRILLDSLVSRAVTLIPSDRPVWLKSYCVQVVYFRVTVHFHLIGPSTLDLTLVDVYKSLKKLYSRALLLAVDFEFEHGVNYLLNNKKNFFNITDLTSELILLDEVSI